jgi:hydrogenase expression/formation protein HypC
MCLAIPTQITAIDESDLATVELGGVERQISLIMTPEARIGDYVLVHTGYAISLMDPEEAQASLEAFAELAIIQAELEREAAANAEA